MRRLSYLPWVFACFVLWGTCANTADTAPSGPLSLQDCIKIAMQNQIDVLTAQTSVITAKSRADQAKSNYFPQLSIQNNAFQFGSQSVLSRVTTGTALSLNQNIFDGGLREANVTSAHYGLKQNSARLTRTTQTVAFNVTKAYYDVLRAKRLAEVAEANVKYTEGLKEQVETRAQLGDAAAVDVLPVEAQLAATRVNLLSAKNTVRTSALSLESGMGLAPMPGFDVQDVGIITEPEVGILQEYVKQAETSRPDVTATKAGTGSARASVRSARINLWPRPTITGQYQRQISGGFTTSGTQIVGGFVFDLFNGGANRAAYREAQALRINAQQQETQIYKDIQVQVEEAYLNLTSSKERLAATQASLAAAQKNYEVQKERYNQGLAITLDLLNAELQLITAQTNEVQALYDYYTAISQMDYAVGR